MVPGQDKGGKCLVNEPKPEAAQERRKGECSLEACAADAALGLERAGHGRHGLDGAGHEGGRGLGHGVIDGDAGSFVEDLNAEDLGRAHRAVLVGAGQGDVERQDLVGIPVRRQFLVGSGVGDGDLVEQV